MIAYAFVVYAYFSLLLVCTGLTRKQSGDLLVLCFLIRPKAMTIISDGSNLHKSQPVIKVQHKSISSLISSPKLEVGP